MPLKGFPKSRICTLKCRTQIIRASAHQQRIKALSWLERPRRLVNVTYFGAAEGSEIEQRRHGELPVGKYTFDGSPAMLMCSYVHL